MGVLDPFVGERDATDEQAEPDEPRVRRRFWRRHKALTVIMATAVVLAVALFGWVFYLNSQLEDIPRFSLHRPQDVHRPARVPGGAENILLIGVDDLETRGDVLGDLEDDRWTPGRYRSDTIMVLHIDADHEGAQLISIPRDSYVEVPGVGTTKINAAFSEAGPSLLVQTVEQWTDLYLDHAVVIDFQDFADVVDILGGVDVTIPETTTDPMMKITWHAGPQHLDGEQAADYTHQRYNLPRGDFDRVQRQQNVLRSLLGETARAGTIANPIRLTSLVSELQQLVAVDDDFTASRMRGLALAMRHLHTGDVSYLTIPTTGTPTINGASVVTEDRSAVRGLFAAVAHDRYADWRAHQTSVDELPPAGKVN